MVLEKRVREENERQENESSLSEDSIEELTPMIGKFDDLDKTQKHAANKYILTGYRLNYTFQFPTSYNNWKDLWNSDLEWHNDTINIYVSLLSIFCLLSMLFMFFWLYRDLQVTDA